MVIFVAKYVRLLLSPGNVDILTAFIRMDITILMSHLTFALVKFPYVNMIYIVIMHSNRYSAGCLNNFKEVTAPLKNTSNRVVM